MLLVSILFDCQSMFFFLHTQMIRKKFKSRNSLHEYFLDKEAFFSLFFACFLILCFHPFFDEVIAEVVKIFYLYFWKAYHLAAGAAERNPKWQLSGRARKKSREVLALFVCSLITILPMLPQLPTGWYKKWREFHINFFKKLTNCLHFFKYALFCDILMSRI